MFLEKMGNKITVVFIQQSCPKEQVAISQEPIFGFEYMWEANHQIVKRTFYTALDVQFFSYYRRYIY